MGIYDEQIRQRIERDDAAFSEAFVGMADVIMGQKLSEMLHDDRIKTKNAIDEVMKYYHVKQQELPGHIKTTIDQLEYLMRPSGIMWHTVLLEGEWYKDSVGALLGTRKDDGSAVALIPRKVSGYDFYNIKSGKRIKVTKSTASVLSEEALCFYKPFPLKETGIKDLLKYMGDTIHFSDYLFMGVSALAVALIGLLIPYINDIIYSDVITSRSNQMLFGIFTFFFCVTVSRVLMEGFKALALERCAGKMKVASHAAGMTRLISLPASFFKDYSSGDIANRMAYMRTVCGTMVNSVLSAALTSVFSLISITQMFRYGPGLVIPGMTVILVTGLAAFWGILIQARVSRQIMEERAKESGLTYELISGLQKIKVAGAEKRAFAKWAKVYTSVAKRTYDPPLILHISKVMASCAALVGTLVIYYFTIKTGVSLADYFAFQASYGIVMGAFTELIGIADDVAQIEPALKMLEPILKEVPEIAAHKKVVEKLSGAIEMNKVSFRYTADMPNVIDGLDLNIRPGQYVAIVGQTGCGKSTLMRLLLGLETAQRGAVYYDRKNLTDLDLKSLRRKIGVVMQEGKLFQGDIFSNITISAPWLTIDDAWEAAELAGIAEDIKKMPMGMHTLISEGAGGISGGQRQRILIARAVVAKPKILMFDEATSALDNLTQKIVSDSLDKLKCTRIVIAHRLSTIRHCDRILVLEKGKIIEDGSYEQLMEKNGFFAELVKRQQTDEVM